MTLENTQALKHVKGALMAVHSAIAKQNGASRTPVKPKADFSAMADQIANNALIDYFRHSGLPAVLYTEELEEPLKFVEKPSVGVIADDIDGTRNHHYGFGMLPHGPIVGIANNPNPKFEDMIASGFLELNSGNLFYAINGEGAYLIESWAKGSDKAVQVHTSGVTSIEQMGSVIADNYMLEPMAIYFTPWVARQGVDMGSEGLHLSLLAAGSFDIFVHADNRRSNPDKLGTGEEIGPLYLLIKEAGGAMVDWRGNDLGRQVIDLGNKRRFHAVAAATPQLATEFTSAMREIREIRDYMRQKEL